MIDALESAYWLLHWPLAALGWAVAFGFLGRRKS